MPKGFPVGEHEAITIEQRKSIGFTPILRAMFKMHPKRTVLGLCSWARKRSSITPSSSPTILS